MMGVTLGGVLVPSPFGYDWELFNSGMGSTAINFYLTSTQNHTPRVVTRIPHNASIDDFEYLYMFLRFSGWPLAEFTISVKNLRTGLSAASVVIQSDADSSFHAYRVALSKTNDIAPGDFIELKITWVAVGDPAALQVATYQKGTFFSDALLVGQAFPFAFPALNAQRFRAPALFFTWQDAVGETITEWMPGLMPMIDRGNVSATRDFCGNMTTMPLSDRRPSGFWFYTKAPGSGTRTVRIYAEPSGPSDVNELYSFSFTAPGGTYRMIYVPFDGSQPALEHGKKYIVGIDMDAPSDPDVFWHAWMRDQNPTPLWIVDPVHLGFDNHVEFTSLVSGAWDSQPDGYHCELGLVFEESEA